MSKAIEGFAKRLMNVLGPHNTAKMPALLKEMHQHLGRYSEDELQEAATLLLASQKNSFWPTFAAMKIAADEARTMLRKARQERTPLGRVRRKNSIGEWYTPRSKSEDEAYWSRDAFEAADRLINSEIGREAAQDGWINELYDYCREARRLPTEREILSLKKKAQLTDAMYAGKVFQHYETGQIMGPIRQGSQADEMLETSVLRRNVLAKVANGQGSGWRWQEDNELKIARLARGQA